MVFNHAQGDRHRISRLFRYSEPVGFRLWCSDSITAKYQHKCQEEPCMLDTVPGFGGQIETQEAKQCYEVLDVRFGRSSRDGKGRLSRY